MIYRDCKRIVGHTPCTASAKACEACHLYSPINERILIIKRNSLGDVLAATPILHALHSRFPNSQISWVVDQRCSELLLNNHFVDHLYISDWRLPYEILPQNWDFVINFDQDPAFSGLAMLLNASNKAGIGLDKNGVLFPLTPESNDLVSWNLTTASRKNIKKSIIEMQFESIGAKFNDQPYILDIPDVNELKRKEYWLLHDIKDDDVVIAVHPGSRSTRRGKRWPIEYWASLIENIRGTIDNKIKIFILVGPDDKDIKDQILNILPSDLDVLIPNDLVSILDLAAIVSQCDLLICNDSFPMHVALATQTPYIALFGPTSVSSYPTYEVGYAIKSNRECSPCFNATYCTDENQCMADIPVDVVLDKAKELLKS